MSAVTKVTVDLHLTEYDAARADTLADAMNALQARLPEGVARVKWTREAALMAATFKGLADMHALLVPLMNPYPLT